MIDALGIYSPFHLEFVRSAEVRQERLKFETMLILEGFRSTLEIPISRTHGTGAQKNRKRRVFNPGHNHQERHRLKNRLGDVFRPRPKSHDEYDPHSRLGAGRKMPKCDAPNFGSSIFGRNVDIDW